MVVSLKFLLFWSQGVYFLLQILGIPVHRQREWGESQIQSWQPSERKVGWAEIPRHWKWQLNTSHSAEQVSWLDLPALSLQDYILAVLLGDIPEIVTPLAWLCGKWRLEGISRFPRVFLSSPQASVSGASIYSRGHRTLSHSLPIVWGWCWCPSHWEEQESN